MLRYSLQNYRTVANSADAALRHAIKRFPSLISTILPTLLSALGGLQLPPTATVRESMTGSEREAAAEAEHRVDVKLVQELAKLALDAASKSQSTEELSAAGTNYKEQPLRHHYSALRLYQLRTLSLPGFQQWLCLPGALAILHGRNLAEQDCCK